MAQRKHAELIKRLVDDDSLEIEYYSALNEKWIDCCIYEFFKFPDEKFRIKPTKPSIDWSHVADEFKFMAISQYGVAKVFTEKPNAVESECKSGGDWWGADGNDVRVDAFKSFKAGTCDWKDSLVQRPEGE